jgi:hypothetical protein
MEYRKICTQCGEYVLHEVWIDRLYCTKCKPEDYAEQTKRLKELAALDLRVSQPSIKSGSAPDAGRLRAAAPFTQG